MSALRAVFGDKINPVLHARHAALQPDAEIEPKADDRHDQRGGLNHFLDIQGHERFWAAAAAALPIIVAVVDLLPWATTAA